MLVSFDELHIDIARNSTDDFNLFHDKKKWQQVHNNPFKGPIVLGFQLEMLIEGMTKKYRLAHDEEQIIQRDNLRFSNYQFSFANAVSPNQSVDVQIRKSIYKGDNENVTLGNRVSIKTDGKLSLMGFKKESQHPLFLSEPNLPSFELLNQLTDRTFLADDGFFVKRKFMTTSNAKNFLCSSLQEQSDFFDEVENKICFPELFPCSLISSALLEKAILEKLDFKRDPMVYTSHKISVDRFFLRELKSNDCLHILVKTIPANDPNSSAIDYECYGIVNQSKLLFRAIISLSALNS
ncbi:MAG: hypothetical protein HRU24_08750 [Gammaproteobacteria bacterium]|nr:hypothetical protein [Gammaproteobacteria bacterium]